MQLLPTSAFDEVFAPLRGKKVGYVRLPGNVGDGMIEVAADQLFRSFGITACIYDFANPAPVEELVIAGGGSMGPYYLNCWELRQRALGEGKPVTVLPQSFIGPEPLPYRRVFVRERDSLSLCPDAVLAPELALGLDYSCPNGPEKDAGLWLRNDTEARFADFPNEGDPILVCRSARQYLELAARHRHVITDRLHFAIAGLICGRRVTLLPNSYHKNQSMFQTWLAGLGCQWAESPEAAFRGKVPMSADLR